jgi:hypothetical protein
MTELLYKELTFAIIGAAMDVEDIDRFGRYALVGIQEGHAGQAGNAGDQIRRRRATDKP